MQKQDFPPYYQVLIKLGLCVGGFVHLFCAPALAISGSTNSSVSSTEVSSLTATSVGDRSVNGLKLSTDSFSESDEPEHDAVESRLLLAGAIADQEPTVTHTAPWQFEQIGLLRQKLEQASEQKLNNTVVADLVITEDVDTEPINSTAASVLIHDTSEVTTVIEQDLETEAAALEKTDEATLPGVINAQNAGIAIAAPTDAVVADLSAQPTTATAADLQVQSEQAQIGQIPSEQIRLENTPAVASNEPDLLSEILVQADTETETVPVLDAELGTLRLVQLRSRENEDLGILRILQTATAVPPPPPAPIAFLTGRLGFVDVDNVFRSEIGIGEQVYQAGLGLYLAPRVSDSTSLYGIIETNIARYNEFSVINYNEVQLQVGLRQRLSPRTYAQIGWRNQRLYSPGYREKLFGAQYIDTLISHRSIFTPKTWLDSFYQIRLGFADPEAASRFRQTFTLSLNYGVSRDWRTSLLYQLDFDDYTQIARYDTYQQVLGVVSYNLTPESRISVFGGTRFGRSSSPNISLDDTFYGAGLNVNVSLF